MIQAVLKDITENYLQGCPYHGELEFDAYIFSEYIKYKIAVYSIPWQTKIENSRRAKTARRLFGVKTQS